MFALQHGPSTFSTPYGSKRFWAGRDPPSWSSHLSSPCSQATETRYFCIRSMKLLSKPEPSFNRHKTGDCYTPRHVIWMLTIVCLIFSNNFSVFIKLTSLGYFMLDCAHDQNCLHRRIFLYANNITSKVYGVWSPRTVMYPGRCFKFFFCEKENYGRKVRVLEFTIL